MFKKVTIIYLSTFLVFMFVMMLLLISMFLLRITNDKKAAIIYPSNNKPDLVLEDIHSNNLIISTDKNIYTSEEPVLISFSNVGPGKMTQDNNSSITVNCRAGIGNNFEVAFIEHLEEDEWIAIEPVNRCSEDCQQQCSTIKEIKSRSTESFVWSQTVLQCNEGSQSTMSEAPLGSYRISSATWDKDEGEYTQIYSDIFRISNLSKK